MGVKANKPSVGKYGYPPWGITVQILKYSVVCRDGIEDIFVATLGGIMRWLNSRCVLR